MEQQAEWMRLPAVLRDKVQAARPESALYEIRLRCGGPMQLVGRSENRLTGEIWTRRQVTQAVSALMEYSLYAWEDELSQGFFTTRSGFRVGVAGRYSVQGGAIHLLEVHSVCIRVARAVPGCADALLPWLEQSQSCLILSAPGRGKTTLLRDLARQLSHRGQAVSILDERCEIAAAWQGHPLMDVGERTDVVEGIGKPEGIPMIVRALSPQVLVTDELGDAEDASAVADAVRCGVRVMATAHAESLAAALARPQLADALNCCFDVVAELSDPPGQLASIYRRGDTGWEQVACPSD
ncbi:MAG: ATPase, T2SS/T4P/T4SS family [Clostridia bacterium]|nr:ATPase, T2SS/T4P/T4SS family [Clostridia bacterium]